MFQIGMPIRFWPYSILTATWLINRIPSRVLDWKTPYEELFDSPPDYTMLRPDPLVVWLMQPISFQTELNLNQGASNAFLLALIFLTKVFYSMI